MLFKKKICSGLVLILILSYNAVVWARTSHDVAVRVAEIGRYRVENQAAVRKGLDLIQTVDVAILSNSDRIWRFVAVPCGNCNKIEMEWSTDNRVWNSFESGMGETMLSGSKSNWCNYRFYIRIKGITEEHINLRYQLLFCE